MSLLEDVFLEDEAGEAQELERVIEGDDYDDRPLSPNSDDNEEKEDEAEEDKRRVDPSKPKSVRVVKNPRFVLNPARLTGPRGIHVIPEHFKDFKFKGKGHEKEDLDLVLKKLEHWAYRLYPKFEFKDCLKKIEMLGKKRTVMVNLHKIRSDQFMSEETVVQKDSSDEEETPREEDEFDKLLQQQIELARSTPAPGSTKKSSYTPIVDRSLLMPKATSSPSISDEQRDRMLKNRKLAEERRLAKLKNDSLKENAEVLTSRHVEIDGITEISNKIINRKPNRSNVLDSSDDEDREMAVNHSVTVDIHTKNNITLTEIKDRAVNSQKNKTIAFNYSDDDEDMASSIDVHSKTGDAFDKIKENIDINLHDSSNGNREPQLDVDEKEDSVNSITIENNMNNTNTDNIKSVKEISDNDIESNTTLSDALTAKECSVSNIQELDKDFEEESSINKHCVDSETDVYEKELRKDTVSANNKENVDRNIEDMMDVDFSDDF